MTEKIDLVDGLGNTVQTAVDRDDVAHYDGLHMQIVIAVIMNSAGKFLVHKRSHEKRVDPGKIDHVCGGMYSGHSIEETVIREAEEEGGVRISAMSVMRQGVNEYNRYCYLVLASTDDEPNMAVLDPSEVEWAAFYSQEELLQKQASHEYEFVKGFFEDMAYVLNQNA